MSEAVATKQHQRRGPAASHKRQARGSKDATMRWQRQEQSMQTSSKRVGCGNSGRLRQRLQLRLDGVTQARIVAHICECRWCPHARIWCRPTLAMADQLVHQRPGRSCSCSQCIRRAAPRCPGRSGNVR
eukprot:8476909-Alexandrium_andersonii.AAC.1